MYWKIFTRSGALVAKAEHTKENLQVWASLVDDMNKKGIRGFSLVYSAKGVALGPVAKVTPNDYYK